MVPLRVRCWSSVGICSRRKAQSRSLDCARDDKVGASDACRHCLAAKQIMFAARSDYLPFLLKEWFLCVSDAGAHVEICGGRKAQSRSLDCARDDKRGARDVCRHCLRREANTGGTPAYACPSNATRCCNSNVTRCCNSSDTGCGRPTPLARALWSEAGGCGEKSGLKPAPISLSTGRQGAGHNLCYAWNFFIYFASTARDCMIGF